MQPSRTTGMAPTQCLMYLTLQAPTQSPLNMEEMRSPTLLIASSLYPLGMLASVGSLVRKHEEA